MTKIFLYTDAAELAEDTRQAMLTAGYLPVRVADMKQAKLLEAGIPLLRDQLDLIGKNALAALAIYGTDEGKRNFVKCLAQALGAIK